MRRRNSGNSREDWPTGFVGSSRRSGIRCSERRRLEFLRGRYSYGHAHFGQLLPSPGHFPLSRALQLLHRIGRDEFVRGRPHSLFHNRDSAAWKLATPFQSSLPPFAAPCRGTGDRGTPTGLLAIHSPKTFSNFRDPFFYLPCLQDVSSFPKTRLRAPPQSGCNEFHVLCLNLGTPRLEGCAPERSRLSACGSDGRHRVPVSGSQVEKSVSY